MKIPLYVELTEEFLSDIMITAFDGTYGGSGYWAAAQNVNGTAFDIREGRGPVDDVWLGVTIVDREDGDSEIWTVDHTVLVRGIAAILGDKSPTGGDIHETIHRAIVNDDAGHIDSSAADCIVQFGLFGTMVYG